MPPIGLLLNGVNFTDLKITIKEATTDATGQAVNAITLNWGSFVQFIIDFLIIAFTVFILIKAMNRLKKKQEEVPPMPPAPSKTEELLSEIRDLLKKD